LTQLNHKSFWLAKGYWAEETTIQVNRENNKNPSSKNQERKSKKSLSFKVKLDFLLMGIATITLYAGVFYTNGFFDTPYTFNTDIQKHDTFFKNRVYHANVILTTKLFAVNNIINAHAIVEIVQGTQPPIPIVYVLFDGSHQVPPKKVFPNLKFQTLYNGQINASKVSDNLYVGNGQIVYDMEGCYDIKVTNGSKFETGVTSFNETVPCQIHIASTEASSTLTTNRYLIGLEIIAISIGFVALRTIIREALKDYGMDLSTL